MPKYDYEIGEVIRGARDYKVGGQLGAGGMGGVYKGRHMDLYRDFAIKVMLRDLAHRTDVMDMFDREARTVARLGEPRLHPGIVEVVDLGRTKDRWEMPYMVMPFLVGETLEDALRREGSFSILESIGMAMHLLKALYHAHERDVVHRDVKPQNIFIAQGDDAGVKNTLKVLDWGISKILARAEDPNIFLGTASWASREQMLGHDVGPLSDVYSAGVVLFECLTGTLPFARYGRTYKALLRTVDVVAPRLRELGDFPPALEALVARALAKDPSGRPPDALAFAEELQEIGRAIRGKRNPNRHVTEQIERAGRSRHAARPEPVTEAGIENRTVEDRTIGPHMAETALRLHQALVAGAAALEDGAAEESAPSAPRVGRELRGVVTGFETTERRRPKSTETVPMQGRPTMRNAVTDLPGPASDPVGSVPVVRYITGVAAAAKAGPARNTVPMAHGAALPRATAQNETPNPVAIETEPTEAENPPSARRGWLFGPTTWKETGLPMAGAAAVAMVLVLGALRLFVPSSKTPAGGAALSDPMVASAASVLPSAASALPPPAASVTPTPSVVQAPAPLPPNSSFAAREVPSPEARPASVPPTAVQPPASAPAPARPRAVLRPSPVVSATGSAPSAIPSAPLPRDDMFRSL